MSLRHSMALIDTTNTSLSSQVSIGDHLIASMLEAAFPQAEITEIRYLSYAFNNKTVLIRANNIPPVVMKISVTKSRFRKLATEVELMEKYSKITDLPLPKVLYRDMSVKRFDFPYVIYSFLPGTNLVDAMTEVTDMGSLSKELAELSSKIHIANHKYAQFSLGSPDRRYKWKWIVNHVIKTGIKAMKSRNYSRVKEVEKFLLSGYENMLEPQSYHIIHRDLQPQNIHWDVNSNKIVGLFDFESAMSGDFHFEFTFLEKLLFLNYSELRPKFYAHYHTINPLHDDFEERIRFYNVLRDLYFFTRSLDTGELERTGAALESIELILFNDHIVG